MNHEMTDTSKESKPLSASSCAQEGCISWKGLTLRDEHLKEVLEGKAFLLQDGAMGTMLQAQGLLQGGEMPELLNLQNPEAIQAIHASYVAAGSEMIATNTFGANAHKLAGKATVEEVFEAAIRVAREAGARYVGVSIGPIGSLLAPLGTVSFQEAYELFTTQVKAAQKYGADIITLETMTDLLEIKAAVRAAKENTSLPVFASMTFGEGGRTFLGVGPDAAACMLNALGVDAVGVNCSLGPDALIPIAATLLQYASCPVYVRPNAGLPHVVDGEVAYDVSPDYFGEVMEHFIDRGVSIIGGCCGTNPSYIKVLASLLKGQSPRHRLLPQSLSLAGARKVVTCTTKEPSVVLVGKVTKNNSLDSEHSSHSSFQEDWCEEAYVQQEAGADILALEDFSEEGTPEIKALEEKISSLQATTPLPLFIHAALPQVIEETVRSYTGKPLISLSGTSSENFEVLIALAQQYGCALVGWVCDEEGLPATAEERFAQAQKIVGIAAQQGVAKRDLVIGCGIPAGLPHQKEIEVSLQTLRLVKEQLGVQTILDLAQGDEELFQSQFSDVPFLTTVHDAGLDMLVVDAEKIRV